jgi:hypothetical protein
MLKRINVVPGTNFFGLFQKVMKQIQFPKSEMKVKVNSTGELFQFNIQYQDDDPNFMGVDVYQIIE